MIIKLKITELNDKSASLESDHQEKINWPIDKLPQNAIVGSVLYFTVNLEEDIGQDNHLLAKEILNEIIGIDNAVNTD